MSSTASLPKQKPSEVRPEVGHMFEHRKYDNERVKPRKIAFDFPADIPKYYAGGDPVKSAILNSINMFLPAWEDVMARTFKDIAANIQDPYLRDQARGFLGQEAVHGRTHAKFCDNLRAQGYDIDPYMNFCDWFFKDFVEKRLGPQMVVSATSSFEHYSDLVILILLDTDFLDDCHPRMKEFFRWHMAEEVEHNSVAFEVLEYVNNGYWLRQMGNALGLFMILFFTVGGSFYLIAQDGKLF